MVVATTTTDSESAVLTGLTDGTSYTITVTATNPVGTGAAASTTSTPVTATGGPAQYSSAVSQFLNAQDELISGQAATATGALDMTPIAWLLPGISSSGRLSSWRTDHLH
jgi:hypothetical protein